VVDGNVERVMTRLYAIATPMPEAKAEVRAALTPLVPAGRPGDFAQAMMDLGATICTPKRPKCMLCPLQDDCQAVRNGDPELYPVKAKKVEKPLRRGAAFIAVRRLDGAVLLAKRPDEGLLGGMSGPPTTNWTSRQDGETDTNAGPFVADWRAAGTVSHVFTHFELRLDVFHAETDRSTTPHGMFWSMPEDLPGEALPTVMKKAIEAALPGATKRHRPY
jgi:A/G-specific adenine glycosylase